MTEEMVIQDSVQEADIFTPGHRIFIQFPDTRWIYRYEVLTINSLTKEVSLLAVDYPEYSRVIRKEDYLRYARYADRFMKEKGPILESLLHNILTIDGYIDYCQ